MDLLADGIWNSLMPDRPIVDRTGLKGRYDLRLEATLGFRMTQDPQPGDQGVVDAIEEQLGLKLEPRMAEVGVLVVERMERPTGN